jgi:hypothetical protein
MCAGNQFLTNNRAIRGGYPGLGGIGSSTWRAQGDSRLMPSKIALFPATVNDLIFYNTVWEYDSDKSGLTHLSGPGSDDFVDHDRGDFTPPLPD